MNTEQEIESLNARIESMKEIMNLQNICLLDLKERLEAIEQHMKMI